MPDWSYRTLFRPLLFRMSAEAARDATLGAMALIARLPLGSLVIRTLGHMEGYPILREARVGLELPCPVGYAGQVDARGIGETALAQLGFGLLEIGPVTPEPIAAAQPIRLEPDRETIVYPHALAGEGLARFAARLSEPARHRLPRLVRLAPMPGCAPEEAAAQLDAMRRRLGPVPSAIAADGLDAAWTVPDTLAYVRAAQALMRGPQSAQQRTPLLLYAPLGYPPERLALVLAAAREHGWDGVVIGDAVPGAGGLEVGPQCFAPTLERIGDVRRHWPEAWIIAGGGVHEPAAALAQLAAGADTLLLHSGLIFSGPGLPKRINEAIAYARARTSEAAAGPMAVPLLPPQAPAHEATAGPAAGPLAPQAPAHEPAAGPAAVPITPPQAPAHEAAAGPMAVPITSPQAPAHEAAAGPAAVPISPPQAPAHEAAAGPMAVPITPPQSPAHQAAAGPETVPILPPQALTHEAAVPLTPTLPQHDTPAVSGSSFWSGWGWMWLLGTGMIIGGVLAWLVAATRVMLPYDEAFLGADHAAVHAWNERLLHFMSHDRITLAGTMISIGILYCGVARFGFRQRQHWAKTALMISGGVGFSSFFLYLGYGYFDPLHALAAALLLPLFMLAMRGAASDIPARQPNLRNDRAWLLAMWGQLCMVILGFALSIGGLTIAAVGITTVFVPSDLVYIGAEPAQLKAWNDRLLPLIAHDRAGFGGALLSDALLVLTASLWGIREGDRWLWRTLLLGGLPAIVSGLSVHMSIGYTDFWHLSPLYLVCVLYIVGLALLYPYMHAAAAKGTTVQRRAGERSLTPR